MKYNEAETFTITSRYKICNIKILYRSFPTFKNIVNYVPTILLNRQTHLCVKEYRRNLIEFLGASRDYILLVTILNV